MNFIFLLIGFFYVSCTPPVQSTLLKDRESCTEENNCIKVQQKEIAGDLSITPNSSQVTVNIEQSDSVEISGSCRDLGRYDNRVIVQVFEGEDEGLQPFIDNTSSFSCMGSRTGSAVVGEVNINGTRCFWNTTGSGIIEATTEFPRCFNGRFSFRVRLGKILRDGSNNIINYLVRMKLRSSQPAGDSPFARVVVNRGLSKPSLTVSRPIDSNAAAPLRCEIQVNPFRGAKIGYELQKIVTAPAGLMPAPEMNIYPGSPTPKLVVFPDNDFGKDAGSTVQKFYDKNVIHGVTYSYSIQASDYKYSPNPPREVSGYSEVVTCKTPLPNPLSCICVGAGNCTASVDRMSNYTYEWHYRDSANWPATSPGGGVLLPTCSIDGASNCGLTGVAPNEKRYVSLRAVHSDGYKGDWMPNTIECVGK